MTRLRLATTDVFDPAAEAGWTLPPRRTAANGAEGGDSIELALRLGSALLGCPLAFTEAGSLLDGGPTPSPLLPAGAFEVAAPIVDEDGEPLGTLTALDLARRAPFSPDESRALLDVAGLIGGDIAARRQIGLVDHVTGLPNRRRFEAGFARSLAAAKGQPVLLLVTLSDARQYNEILRALGHGRAEDFLRRGASIIEAHVGPGRLHHVSVLSFAVLTDPASEDAEALARDLVATFAGPVVCDGIPIMTRIGVGLSRLDPASTTPSEALRSALTAAQDSRRAASGFGYYDRRSDEAHLRAFRLLTDLAGALRTEDQLSLVFQPRIDLATGGLAGAETLLRWTHPSLGPVSPAEFVPLAETTALIGPLTNWVLERACRQSRAWLDDGLAVKLSVNVAPASLHDAAFVGGMADLMRTSRIDPTKLEFEFTEGTFTSFAADVGANIETLRSNGATIAIDDFGTGYSNLGYLTNLPVDVLKIDRSFVQPMDADPRRRKLVRSIIDMSHDLGFAVVAEGVETASAYEMLGFWGCDEGQGYYMSRPLPPDQFAAYARSH